MKTLEEILEETLFRVPKWVRGFCCHASHYRKPTKEDAHCDLCWSQIDPEQPVWLDDTEELDASFRDRITKKSTTEYYRCDHNSSSGG